MSNALKTYLSHCPSYKHWQLIGIKHHHGINIPLFSLRSKQSCGIGEFTDLYQLIDWCHEIGLDIIQLLPLNHMGKDHSPYNALSSCALDPIYLGLKQLPLLDQLPAFQKDLDELTLINNQKRIDYSLINTKKRRFLEKYFDAVFDDIKTTTHYQSFLKNNKWLDAYSLFYCLKEHYDPLTWSQWPDKHKNITKQVFDALLHHHQVTCDFWRFLQYLCFHQIALVKEYASNKQVFIKGDIPILINRDSADVWHDRIYFDLSHSAGCPPDDFNKAGQNWGFPLFNWETLKSKDYTWWKRRLNVASSCYHLYRVDHAVGFFRIWSLFMDEDPKFGKFIPKQSNKWKEQGEANLNMLLEASYILPIAEDLGLIPRITYITLRKLGICGTKILRWQRKWGRYIKYKNYEPLSITTIGTHDQMLLGEWWKEKPKEAKKFARFKNWIYNPHLTFEQRKAILYDSHHTASLFHVNLLQEYTSLFPELTWDNSKDERINSPGTISDRNWSYRTKCFLEELTVHEGLKKQIREIISSSLPE